jgi:NAD(P)-dependent dehydrogenase (short-subunit alcohol dehydrogenase family)
VFKETAEKFGRIDLVFCNAGISPPNVPLAEQKLSDWQATVDVNLTAAWLCAREAYRYMEKQTPQGGRIIINGSISAYAPRPNSSPYTATKTAMTGLTKSLSLDGRKFNIAVTQIDVGNAASEMTAKMKEGPGVPQVSPHGLTRLQSKTLIPFAWNRPTDPCATNRQWTVNGKITQPQPQTTPSECTHTHFALQNRVGKEIVHIAEMPLSVNSEFQMSSNLAFKHC